MLRKLILFEIATVVTEGLKNYEAETFQKYNSAIVRTLCYNSV
jgi:hypothetical protein